MIKNPDSKHSLFSYGNSSRGERCTLWLDRQGTLTASVDDTRGRHWLPKEQIYNIYRPSTALGDHLERYVADRGSDFCTREWVLIHRQGRLYVGPSLLGAARDPDAKRLFVFPDDYERAKAHPANKRTYRKELIRYTDYHGGGRDAHHSIARAVEYRLADMGLNIHAPFYLAWVDSQRHRVFSHEHYIRLNTWISNNQGATPVQLCKFVTDEADKFEYQIGSFPGEFDLGTISAGQAAKAEQGVRRGGFAEKAQATGLVKTYNASNPGRPLAQQGKASGQIGGVGIEPGLIEGLKDSMCDLLEYEHLFVMPTVDGRPPFSDAHLRQIIREMTTNIFYHGRQPMFSLHFNQDGTMYPIIPPEYQDTLVGRVMGMLDYMMKGYLSGGVFAPSFVERWQASGRPPAKNSLEHLICLRTYCRQHLGDDLEYISIHEMMPAMGAGRQDGQDLHHRSSFRIIADNPMRRRGNVFQIGTEFRVEYTLEVPPEVEAERQRHRREHGAEPADVAQLHKVYSDFAEGIRRRMPELPMCREYFNMLGVIHFLSHYLPTLKSMDKVPVLPQRRRAESVRFPDLLPPLPIRRTTRARQEVDLWDIAQTLSGPDRRAFEALVLGLVAEASQSGRMPTDETIRERLLQGLTAAATAKIATTYDACLERGLQGASLLPAQRAGQQPRAVPALALMVASLVETTLAAKQSRDELLRRHAALASTYRSNQQTAQAVTNQIAALDGQVQAVLDRFDSDVRDALKGFDDDVAAKRPRPPEYDSFGLRDWRGYQSTVRVFEDQCRQQRGENQGRLARRREDEVARCAAWKREQLAELTNVTRRNATILQQQVSDLATLRGAADSAWGPACAPMGQSQQALQSHRVAMQVPQTVLFPDGCEAAADDAGVRVDIVGGCGLALAHRPSHPLVGGPALVRAVERALAVDDPETTRAVDCDGRSLTCFKLPVVDCVVESDDEYRWLLATLGETSPDGAGPLTQLRLAVVCCDPAALDEAWRQARATGAEAASLLARPAAEDGMSLLHLACTPGAAALVRRLLGWGADPCAANAMGLCPLHLAAATGDVELVAALLASPRRAELVRASARDGTLPIHVATRAGHMGVVEALVEAGSSLLAATSHGMTPLLSACHHGWQDVAVRLLNGGDYGQAVLEDGRGAMHLAAETGLVEVLGALRARGFSTRQLCKAGRTALHTAARANRPAVIDALVGQAEAVPEGGHPLIDMASKAGATALGEAARHGCLAAVKRLVAAGARLDLGPPANEGPLVVAIRHGQEDIACLLAQVSEASLLADRSALELASRHGMRRLLHALYLRFVDAGDDPRLRPHAQAGRTGVAHLLCRAGDLEALEAYVASGWLAASALALADEHGRTPFELAVRRGHAELVEQFELRGWPGATWEPLGGRLSAAVRFGMVEILAQELDRGADADAWAIAPTTEQPGQRLVHLAASSGQAACLRLLLGRGAVLDARGPKDKRVVLRAAIESGDPKTVDQWVRHIGSIAAALPPDGRTPGELAAAAGDCEMVRWLYRNGVPLLQEPASRLLMEAAARGNHAAVVEMACSLPDAPAPPASSLSVAARLGHIEVLVALLAAGAAVDDLDEGETSPLTAAAEGGQVRAVRVLIAAGAPLGGEVDGPLEAAANAGHEALLIELLGHPGAPACLARPGAGARLFQAAVRQLMLKAAARLMEMLGPPRNVDELVASADEAAPMVDLLTHGPEPMLRAEAALAAALAGPGEAAVLRALAGFHPAQQLSLRPGEGSLLWPVAFHVARRPSAPQLDAWLDAHRAQVLRARDEAGNTIAHVDAACGRPERWAGEDDPRNHAGQTPLMAASQGGQTEAVTALVAAGAAPAAVDHCGRTALHMAAAAGHHQVIERLAKGKGHLLLDNIDGAGRTPLMAAVEGKQEEAALALLRQGADPNRAGRASLSRALHTAATTSSEELVTALMMAGADPMARDGRRRTALHLAAAACQVATARVLLQADRAQMQSLDGDGKTPLHLAAQAGCLELVELFVEHLRWPGVACRDHRDLTPLLDAAGTGGTEVFARLWQAGAAVDARGHGENDAPSLAARAGDLDLADYLDGLAPSRTPQQHLAALAGAAIGNAPLAIARLAALGVPLGLALPGQSSALSLACRFGSSRAVCALLRRAGDVSRRNSEGLTALCEAVRAGSLSAIRQLLLHQPSLLNEPAPGGRALLHWAIEAAPTPAITCLLVFGADLAARDEMGRYAAQVAAKRGRSDLVGLLLAFGSPTGDAQTLGSPAARYAAARRQLAGQGAGRLHVASLVGDIDGVAALVAVDDVTAGDSCGRTPLHLAASAEVAERLVLAGAPIDAPDISGAGPLLAAIKDESRAARRSELVAILLAQGAQPHARNDERTTPLLAAFHAGDLATFEVLRAALAGAARPRHGQGLDMHLWEAAFASAFDTGDVSEVAYLAGPIEASRLAQTMRQHEPALWSAALKCPSLLRLLVDFFRLPTRLINDDGQNLLHLAAIDNQEEAAKYLHDRDEALAGEADAQGCSPLQRAIEKGSAVAAMLSAETSMSFAIPRWDIHSVGRTNNVTLRAGGPNHRPSLSLPPLRGPLTPQVPRRRSTGSLASELSTRMARRGGPGCDEN